MKSLVSGLVVLLLCSGCRDNSSKSLNGPATSNDVMQFERMSLAAIQSEYLPGVVAPSDKAFKELMDKLTYDERLRAFIGAYSVATADASFWRTIDKNHPTEMDAFNKLSNDQREDVIKGMALMAVRDVHEEFKHFKA